MRLFVLSVLSFLCVSCVDQEQQERERQEYRARIAALYESSVVHSLFTFVDKHPERFIVECTDYSINWKQANQMTVTDTESKKIYHFTTGSIHCHELALLCGKERLFENIASRSPVLGSSFEAARAVNTLAARRAYQVWLNNRQKRMIVKQKDLLNEIGVKSNEVDVSHTVTEDSININVVQSPDNNRNIDVTIE